ncbi:hypothetical protein BOTCAL_0163g00030 [Botryotinia calthae]|uniref:Uncharacterized protein n=1 Tax=Botryotinia calthae TaxID=38488 RepID=A0A4Y8D3Z0_9HELO|nr:hypothetical protein BOTCAL_0163g00030 [Botryotinia calthae]
MAQPVNTKKYVGNLNLFFVEQFPSHIMDNRVCDGLFPDEKLKFFWEHRKVAERVTYCQLFESFTDMFKVMFWERKNGLPPDALYLCTGKAVVLYMISL